MTKVSRQAEAGAVTRRETRRRLLAAAGEEFAERGYAAATVARIAERAGVSVQTLYLAWGSKRALLRGLLERALTGSDEGTLQRGQPPAPVVATLDPATERDPQLLVAHLARQFRLLAERTSVAWHTYRDAAAIDPDIAEDWRQLMDMRRAAFASLLARLPEERLRPGLTREAAVDTAWVIASPDAHEQLVRLAGYSYDDFERWVRVTVHAALLRD